MISILFGPDGSGKSFYQMHVIVRELRFSKRNICTNLAIKVPEFNSYLESTYPGEDIRLVERLRILDTDETFHFWDFRGPRRWTGIEYDAVESLGENGVAFIIDEAGANGFSAQGWAQKENGTARGVKAGWYLDQQRKFTDNVYASHNGTNPHGIAKPFRDKARDFVQLRNGNHVKMGVFKARGVFTAWHYRIEPGPNVEFFTKEDFPLDLELANCYETEKGVGVHGKAGADKGAKAKGIPVMWAFPFAIALGSLCFIGPWALGKMLGHHVQGTSKTINRGVDRALGAVSGQPVGGPVVATASVVPGLTVSGFAEYPTGKTAIPGGWLETHGFDLRLSDGSHVTSADTLIQQIAWNYFKVGDAIYKVVLKAPGAVVAAEEHPNPAPVEGGNPVRAAYDSLTKR